METICWGVKVIFHQCVHCFLMCVRDLFHVLLVVEEVIYLMEISVGLLDYFFGLILFGIGVRF